MDSPNYLILSQHIRWCLCLVGSRRKSQFLKPIDHPTLLHIDVQIFACVVRIIVLYFDQIVCQILTPKARAMLYYWKIKRSDRCIHNLSFSCCYNSGEAVSCVELRCLIVRKMVYTISIYNPKVDTPIKIYKPHSYNSKSVNRGRTLHKSITKGPKTHSY